MLKIKLFFATMVFIEIIATLTANGCITCLVLIETIFIIVSNMNLRQNGRNLQTSDIIVNSIATLSLILDIAVSLYLCFNILDYFCDLPVYAQKTITFLIVTLTATEFWFTAWLCVFYCMKIVNMDSKLFIWLKQKLPDRILPCLIISMVLCILNGWPLFLFAYTHHEQSFTANYTARCEVINELPMETITLFFVFMLFFLFCVPMILLLSACLVIVFYLRQHLRQMKGNMSGFSPGPSLKNQILVCRMIMSLAVLYTLCSMLLFINNIIYFEQQNFNFIIASCFTFHIFCLGNSLILIFSNVHLRQKLMSLCRRTGSSS